MRNTKKHFELILVVVLLLSLLYTPALAAAGRDGGFVTVVPYTFSVDGQSVSLWAFKIGDASFSFKAYFKLRDVAMALNGTDKQFNVSWDESKNTVLLTTGTPYAPAGGELKAPANDTGTSLQAIQPTTVFYIDQRQIPMRSYIVNGAHYVELSDLAENLLLAFACDEVKHTVDINTKTYNTDIYSFSLPEGWSAGGDASCLDFSRSGDPVGSLTTRPYDPDEPVLHIDNHREALSPDEALPEFPVYPAVKRLVRADVKGLARGASDNSYVYELHIYIILADLRRAFDFSFDSAKVNEQTAMEIAKSFVPKETAIKTIKIDTMAAQWAYAVRDHDGRAQYELLSAELQSRFKDYYEAVNWSTGVSSPWVNSWTIEVSEDRAVVFYRNETSGGFAGYTIDNLFFSEESGQLKISGVDGFNDFSGYSSDKDAIPLQFRTGALDYKKLPLLDESKVTQYIGEGESNGITQGFYKARGNTGYDITDYFTYGDEDRGYYSYIVIGGVKYDLGWVSYEGSDKDYLLRVYGIKSADIRLDTPVYKVQRLYGLAAPTTSYLTIENGIPYIIFDTPDWSAEYDLDGDGVLETVANAGTGTSPDYVIYEWSPSDKTIRYVRLTDALDCDIVTYLGDRNLFSAYSYDDENTAGRFGPESMYQYKDGKLIQVKESSEVSVPESAVYSPDGSFAAWSNVQENLKDENGKFYSIYQVLLCNTQTGNVTVFDIVGRDFKFLWSEDSKLLAVTYSGREWTHFGIVDTAALTETPGPYMDSVIEQFEAQGEKFDYTVGETRPDPALTPVKWLPDGSKILVSYEWHDPSYATQSGTFVYEVQSGSVSELIQNAPFQAG